MERAEKLLDILRVTDPAPLQGEDFQKFYVDTTAARGRNPVQYLSSYFTTLRAQPQRVLFTGHRGCGKSTELYNLGQQLANQFMVVNFSISREVDPLNFQFVDLAFLIMERLFQTAAESNLSINEDLLETIHSWTQEVTVEQEEARKAGAAVSAGVGAGAGPGLIKAITGLFAEVKATFRLSTSRKETIRQKIEPRISQLLERCNQLIREVNTALGAVGKQVLIIVEDLDKLRPEDARRLFLDNSAILTAFHCHIVYTFPIALLYSARAGALTASFQNQEILPMIRVTTRERQPLPEGGKCLREMISKRVAPELLEEQAQNDLISFSGGSPRHLFDMLREAAQDASARGLQQVDGAAVKRGILRLQNLLERSLTERSEGGEKISSLDYYRKLVDVYQHEQKKPASDSILMDLLDSQAVLEYDDDRWCDVHPVVVRLLKDLKYIT